jgi:hypothetical protein
MLRLVERPLSARGYRIHTHLNRALPWLPLPLAGGSVYLTDRHERYNRESDRLAAPAGLLDVAEPATFPFDGIDRLFGISDQNFEYLHRRNRATSLLVLDRYKDVECSVVLKMRAPLNAGVFDLVFRAIPHEWIEKPNRLGQAGSANLDVDCLSHDECDQGVLTQITQVVEDVNSGSIPSLVTLERSQERLDFRRQVLATTPYAVVEIGGSISDRKGDVSRIGAAAGSQMGAECRVIETGPRMLDDFGGENAPPKWEALSELQFVDFVGSVRIVLHSMGVWLFSEKLRNLGFEVLEMFLCALDPDVSAIEGRRIEAFDIIHDKIRSDKRPGISEGGAALSHHAAAAT